MTTTEIPTDLEALLNHIQSTKQELHYWHRQKALRTDRQAKIDAGARILIWESQLRNLTAKYELAITLAA